VKKKKKMKEEKRFSCRVMVLLVVLVLTLGLLSSSALNTDTSRKRLKRNSVHQFITDACQVDSCYFGDQCVMDGPNCVCMQLANSYSCVSSRTDKCYPNSCYPTDHCSITQLNVPTPVPFSVSWSPVTTSCNCFQEARNYTCQVPCSNITSDSLSQLNLPIANELTQHVGDTISFDGVCPGASVCVVRLNSCFCHAPGQTFNTDTRCDASNIIQEDLTVSTN